MHSYLIDNQLTAAVGRPLRTDYIKVHQLFGKDTGEPNTQDTFMDIAKYWRSR